MNTRADELRSEVLALPDGARAELVIGILDSLDDRSLVEDQDDQVEGLGGPVSRVFACDG
jgi:hypothetical protein